MNVIETIKKRRSIRKYEACRIPKEDFETMLTAGMMAPSATNSRPWSFIVLQDENIMEELAKVHPFARHIRQAKNAIVVNAIPDCQQGIGVGFWPQDCGACIQNILLAAEELGYKTCWCGIYPNERIQTPIAEILQLDSSVVPVALLVIGKSNEEPTARGFYDSTKVEWR